MPKPNKINRQSENKASYITNKNPVVNEIISFRPMNHEKLYDLNRNKPGKATGWLSESRNK